MRTMMTERKERAWVRLAAEFYETCQLTCELWEDRRRWALSEGTPDNNQGSWFGGIGERGERSEIFARLHTYLSLSFAFTNSRFDNKQALLYMLDTKYISCPYPWRVDVKKKLLLGRRITGCLLYLSWSLQTLVCNRWFPVSRKKVNKYQIHSE